MLEQLKSAEKVIGAKQVTRALKNASVSCVYLAHDAEPKVTEPIVRQCSQESVPVEMVDTMEQLGRACGIAVGSAVAAVLK